MPGKDLSAELFGDSAKPGGKDLSADLFGDEPVKKQDVSMLRKIGQGLGNIAAGGVRGAGSIGATILTPYDLLAGNTSSWGNPERRSAMDAGLQELGADPTSLAYKTGKLGTEIAGTLPVGGLLGGGLAKGAAAVSPAAARAVAPLAQAIQSGGFNMPSAGGNAALNMITRMAGGGINAAATSSLIDPETAKTAALFGAAMPPAAKAVGALGKYTGDLAKSLVRPFTEKGQDIITGNIIRKALGESPIAANEIVPGSIPTLAEATGNANIAGLQRTIRDTMPNGIERFAQRDAGNAAARNAYFDTIAGDRVQLEFYKGMRDVQSKELYDKAIREGFGDIPKATQKQIAELMKTPAMREAVADASTIMQNLQIPKTKQGSIQGLLYAKQALDQQIGKAFNSGLSADARSLMQVKDKLGAIIEKTSPAAAEANAVYNQMSIPVNQMELLQGLRLTDARGNITLQKVQNALNMIEQKSYEKGANSAKSLESSQIKVLEKIRDDLLRSGNQQAGKAIGSNTLQNIATNNFLSSALPGRLGDIAIGKAGIPLAQLGKLAYSGANEAMREKLAQAMLNPAYAEEIVKAAALADKSKYGGLLTQTLQPIAPSFSVLGASLLNQR